MTDKPPGSIWTREIVASDKPLTLPAGLAVILVIALIPTAALAFGKQGEAISRTCFFAGFSLLLVCIPWHYWAARSRPDQEPDILAAFFSPDVVFHFDACHLATTFVVTQSVMRLIVVVQNRFDGDADFELTLGLCNGFRRLGTPIPPLRFPLGSSAVMLATFDVCLVPSDKDTLVSLKPQGFCRRHARSPLVRFARRSVLQTEIKTWMTVLLALGGHIHIGGARQFQVRVPPTSICTTPKEDSQWQISELWTPSSRPSQDQVAERLAEAVNVAADLRDDIS